VLSRFIHNVLKRMYAFDIWTHVFLYTTMKLFLLFPLYFDFYRHFILKYLPFEAWLSNSVVPSMLEVPLHVYVQ